MYHKFVNVDVDPMSKVNRPEWATARYHANYSPTCAFELQVQWMVATGTVLGELVSYLHWVEDFCIVKQLWAYIK